MSYMPFAPCIREFAPQEEVDSYDVWFRERIERSRADTRPCVPHDQAIAKLDEMIVQARIRGKALNALKDDMTADYEISHEVPSVEDYLHLRLASGLTPRSMEAAEVGLPRTVTSVLVNYDHNIIGMGRVIGDGLCYQVVDVAVLPEYQGRGIGKIIMSKLMNELKRIAPAEAYVSLIADGPASFLYRKFGFEETAPTSVGMAQWINK